MSIASINGEIASKVSIFDRGILFGESLYEVIPLYQNKPFKISAHLDRLISSYQTLFHYRLNREQITSWILSYIDQLDIKPFSAIYLHCSTGSKLSKRSHLHYQMIEPNIMIFEYPCDQMLPSHYQNGCSAILFPDLRSQMANHKSTQLSINTMALNQANQQGFDDAIFIKDDWLTEAASSNLFIVKDSQLITPPLQHIVPGVTRQCILDIAHRHGIRTEVRPIHVSELKQCSEVFLTSSIKILKPITQIQHHISLPKPGSIWLQLFHHYLHLTHEYTTTCS